MASPIINSKTKGQKLDKIFTVRQATQSALYSAILAGTATLPPTTFVAMVTSGDVKTVKIIGNDGLWSTGIGVGGSSASQTAVAGLALVATANASDLPTAIALANDNKAKLNALISALKS